MRSLEAFFPETTACIFPQVLRLRLEHLMCHSPGPQPPGTGKLFNTSLSTVWIMTM
jgi:hypothetical protein